MTDPFLIMTLDGGGLCGLYTLSVLESILVKVPDLLDRVDLFAGTSTGGLITLALAMGMTVAQVIQLYLDRGAEIFDRSWARAILSPFGLTQAKYDNTGLIKVCQDTFGGRTLGTLKKRVMVPSFRLKGDADSGQDAEWGPCFFHNLDPVFNGYYNQLAADVAIRTSSAPTFFPSYQGYIDGGVACNDPAMAAVALAVAKERVPLTNVRVLSLGTGTTLRYVQGANLNWGGAQWIRDIVNVFMDSMPGVTNQQLEWLLGTHYQRLDAICPDVPMDDLSAMPDLIAEGKTADLTDILQWLPLNYVKSST